MCLIKLENLIKFSSFMCLIKMLHNNDIEMQSVNDDENSNNDNNRWKLSKKQWYIGGYVFCTIFWISLILILVSLNDVEWNELAFQKNTITNTVDREKVYTYGRYFWGVSSEPLIFPRAYQKIEFRGNDLLVFAGSGQENNTAAAGLEFGIECDVYYRLTKENLKEIFNDFGTAYHDRFVDAVRASIKNTAPEFSVDNYVNQREQITKRFREELNNDLKNLHLTIDQNKFLLLRIVFPVTVLNKFQETVMKKLEIDKEILNRVVGLYQKGTEELVKEIRANISIINQETNATAEAVVLEAKATSIKIHQEALGRGINNMINRLNITNQETRSKVFQLYTIEDNTGSGRILLGDEKNILSVG